jgi:hypothetical protein
MPRQKKFEARLKAARESARDAKDALQEGNCKAAFEYTVLAHRSFGAAMPQVRSVSDERYARYDQTHREINAIMVAVRNYCVRDRP